MKSIDIQTDLFLLLLRRKAEERGGYVTPEDVEATFWDLSSELKTAIEVVAGRISKAHVLFREKFLPGLIVTAQLDGIDVRKEVETDES